MYAFVTVSTCLLLAPVLSRPHHDKRYDLDGNGIPDWCWSDGISAHCLRSDGSWTAVPATEGKTTIPGTAKPSTSVVRFSTTTVRSAITIVVTTANTVIYPTSESSTPFSFSNTTLQMSSWSTTASSSPTCPPSATALGKLPSPSQFKTDKGSKWSITYQGDLKYTDTLGSKNLRADKGRTGKIGNKIIWNFGDMQCHDNWQICGFSIGPAFYGMSNDVMTVNTTGMDSIEDNDFVQPWSGDAPPQAPHWAWGMDTSNVAPINDTHGVAFAWEIWRGASDGSSVDRGNAIASITLGADQPVANRVGPLLTGPDSIQLGLLAILRDKGYIYTYSVGGPSNLIIGRAPASDAIFDPAQHSFLGKCSTANSPQWIPGVPDKSATSVGASTASPSGQFGCSVYGSVFYNTYLHKYVIVCSIYMNFVNMYTSDTPWGPWSAEYELMNGADEPRIAGSYGSMVHEMYGSGKEVYLSLGPNDQFYMYKLEFSGY